MPPLYQIIEGGKVNGVHIHHVMRQKDAGKLQTLADLGGTWKRQPRGNSTFGQSSFRLVTKPKKKKSIYLHPQEKMLEKQKGQIYSAPKPDIRPRRTAGTVLKPKWNHPRTLDRKYFSIQQFRSEANVSHLTISKQLEDVSKTRADKWLRACRWARAFQSTDNSGPATGTKGSLPSQAAYLCWPNQPSMKHQ